MTIELLTKEDLKKWKDEIIAVIKETRNGLNDDRILKSFEVKDILKCSDATLQKHRIYGRLPFRKVGGTYYYTLSDINNLLEKSIAD